MSVARGALCALLLALVGIPLSFQGLEATSYGGWPAIGFAIALLLVTGPQWFWQAVVAMSVMIAVAVMHSYDVSFLSGFLASIGILLPALYAQRGLTKTDSGRIRLDEVDSGRYHTVTAVAALICGVLAMAATATVYDTRDVLLSGLMSFLAALTAQLAVLPLLIQGSALPAAGSAFEVMAQRISLVLAVGLVFGPTTRLGVVFVIFPMLGWAANRATRREAHWQLFLVCITTYLLTLSGRGPLAGSLNGVPESLQPTMIYLFMAAACYMTVPLTMTVERLVAMTSQATRAASTVERLLGAVTGALIIATDAEGRITHFNTGAEDTLGYSPEEVLGQSPGMFHTPQELARQAAHFGVRPRHHRIVLEMVRRGERRDWEFVRKDGARRMATLTLSEVTGVDGQVIGFIGAGDDITERLRAQEALMAALEREHASVLRLEEVDHVKQELVSNVSHELRTPITSIAGYIELLADGDLGGLSAEQADAVERIGRNTTRLDLLVQDLLTLSRVEAGELDLAHESIDLREVLAESYELFEEVLRVRDLEVSLQVPDAGVETVVLGDGHALERVVLNLLGNAVKFTPDGGRVRLVLERRGAEVLLSVSDTGMGISAEDQLHLFRRFFRTSAATEQAIQGSGLGLSIVHSIVTQHGGTVSVESAPGAGTTVTVQLPSVAEGLVEPSDVVRRRAHHV